MPNEVADDVQLDDPTQQTATVPEGDAAQAAEPEGGPDAQAETHEPDNQHPLEPGGKRFNQVYARAKDAEARLHSERERAARLEGELEALKRAPVEPKPAATPPRYTASQLQAMIDEGKATIGQVLAYQEETLKLELEAKVDKKVAETLSTHQRGSTVQQELNTYKTLVPEALQPGTPENQRVMKEFAYLVNMGYDRNDPRTEVLAARAAFGDPDSLKTKLAAKAIPAGRDTMQDTTQSGKPKPTEKDPLKDLTARERQHYQHMIDRGVYSGWAEVKDELTYTPKRR